VPARGLRARKRAATQAPSERAAITLALEHGYENVTVDAICEPRWYLRTFFNYFSTKRRLPRRRPTHADGGSIHRSARERHLNVLGDLRTWPRLCSSTLTPTWARCARCRLTERTPELLASEITRVAEMEKTCVPAPIASRREVARSRHS
jgi:hypothetical protein